MAANTRGHRGRRWRTVGLINLVTHVNPVTLYGIALSIGLAVVLALADVAQGGESVLVGLSGMTISLVLDASARAERRFELRQLVSADPWLGETLARMAQTTQDIVKRYPGSEIEADARQRFQCLSEELDELRRGRVVRPGNDYEQLIAATEACLERIEAVTNVVDEPAWWRSTIGRRYWQANVDAIARGVSITRVFVCGCVSAELATLVECQRQAGVTVEVVNQRDVDRSLHLNVVVWDRKRAWEGRTNARGDIVANVFLVNETEVDRIHGVYRMCAAANRMAGI
jgi:hypothetical protein